MNHRNILLIVTDQQRGDTLDPGVAAAPPNLARFAAQGVRFSQARCPSPHCCPARATLFTGLLPSRHGVWNNLLNDWRLSDGLRPGVHLLSDPLREAGYDLHWAGKWHVDRKSDPHDHGWQEHLLSAGRDGNHGNLSWQQHVQSAAQPGDGPGVVRKPGWAPMRLYGPCAGEDHDEDVVRHGERLLRGELARSDRPWALYLGLFLPHDPYNAPQRFLDRLDPARDWLPAGWDEAMADKPGLYRRMRRENLAPLGRAGLNELVRHYRARCLYLDELVGRVLIALEASGRDRDTIVAFCSDHGDYAGDHGLIAKGLPCFDGAYRVPLALRVPGAPAGLVVDRLACLSDVFPTLLDLAGLSVPTGLCGASLSPFVHGRAPATWRDAHLAMCNGTELWARQRILRTARWTYAWNGFDEDELYDRTSDPGELRNLAADPAHQAVLRQLSARTWAACRDHGDTAPCDYLTVNLAPVGPGAADATVNPA
jgi:arylsulfatase A-like enzyme